MTPIAEFKKGTDAMIRRIRGSAKAKGSARIWLSGEMEAKKMKEVLAHGMDLPRDVRDSLRGLADDQGIEATWT